MEQEKFEIHDEIKCPYCGWEDEGSWEYDKFEEDGDRTIHECPECDKKFDIEFHVERKYWTRGLCEANHDKHNWEKFDGGKKCLTCDEYKFNKKE